MTKIMSQFSSSTFPRVKILSHVKSDERWNGTWHADWLNTKNGRVACGHVTGIWTRTSDHDSPGRVTVCWHSSHSSWARQYAITRRFPWPWSSQRVTRLPPNTCIISCHQTCYVKWPNNIPNLVVNPPGSTNLSHRSICYIQFCQH